jgi:hypothetical protein
VDLRYIGFAMNEPALQSMITRKVEIGHFHALPVT